ncbi:hypothetical protein VAWG007_12260 [Aeromonas enteropelogenes]|nr:hypothetical protein VAWG007_12260 [Aeromonas enteropelogenes]
MSVELQCELFGGEQLRGKQEKSGGSEQQADKPGTSMPGREKEGVGSSHTGVPSIAAAIARVINSIGGG